MKSIRENEAGDWELTGRESDYIYDVEAVLQATKTKLNLWQGQYFLDTDEGTPYQAQILGVHTKDKYALPIIKDRIYQVPYVTKITSLTASVDSSTRTIGIYFSLITEFGAIKDEKWQQ